MMPGMPAFTVVGRTGDSLRLLILVAVALLIGYVTGDRGWLAASAAYVLGIVFWTVVYLKPSPPWAPSDNWTIETWSSFVMTTVLFGAVLYAIFGMIGSWIPTWRARLAAR
jgi:hypothetical protein